METINIPPTTPPTSAPIGRACRPLADTGLAGTLDAVCELEAVMDDEPCGSDGPFVVIVPLLRVDVVIASEMFLLVKRRRNKLYIVLKTAVDENQISLVGHCD